MSWFSQRVIESGYDKCGVSRGGGVGKISVMAWPSQSGVFHVGFLGSSFEVRYCHPLLLACMIVLSGWTDWYIYKLRRW